MRYITDAEADELHLLVGRITEILGEVERRESKGMDIRTSQIVSTLTYMSPKYQDVVKRIAKTGASRAGEIDGRIYADVMEVTQGFAKSVGGGKRIITTMAYKYGIDVKYNDTGKPYQVVEVSIPSDLAYAARTLWPHQDDPS